MGNLYRRYGDLNKDGSLDAGWKVAIVLFGALMVDLFIAWPIWLRPW